MVDTVLVRTVGGSHEPILTAVKATRPAYTCFACTDTDPTTGKPGSRVQVEGGGLVIKAGKDDAHPTLPNIPTQLGLGPEQYEVALVPADDLDDAFAVLAAGLDRLRARYPDARFVADYTGGTKTMTAALVTAVLERDDVDLQLVTGARDNLVRVCDGTQDVAPATVDAIRLRRSMAPFLAAWGRFAYGEAALGLDALGVQRGARLRADLAIARDLSRAFDAWDRFDHAQALAGLGIYQARLPDTVKQTYFEVLNRLTASSESPGKEALRVLDVWRNAERRAAQGRYDDAVARVYRFLEWSAQWLLRSRAGIDTADVPPERIPEATPLREDRNGRRPAGLFDAWRLVAHHLSGPAAELAKARLSPLQGHLEARNRSILAHGFTPVDEAAWGRFHAWVESEVLPAILSEARTDGVRGLNPQLPQTPIWR